MSKWKKKWIIEDCIKEIGKTSKEKYLPIGIIQHYTGLTVTEYWEYLLDMVEEEKVELFFAHGCSHGGKENVHIFELYPVTKKDSELHSNMGEEWLYDRICPECNERSELTPVNVLVYFSIHCNYFVYLRNFQSQHVNKINGK